MTTINSIYAAVIKFREISGEEPSKILLGRNRYKMLYTEVEAMGTKAIGSCKQEVFIGIPFCFSSMLEDDGIYVVSNLMTVNNLLQVDKGGS